MSLTIYITPNQKIKITNYELDDCVINHQGLITPDKEVITVSKWQLEKWHANCHRRGKLFVYPESDGFVKNQFVKGAFIYEYFPTPYTPKNLFSF